MRHPVTLVAIVLLTGSLTGGVALGNYATGNWKTQPGSFLDQPLFEDAQSAPPSDSATTLIAATDSGPHICHGCDAGAHLRNRWRDGTPDAYADDYGADQPPIAPDAYEVEPDWGGGRPVRAETAEYRVAEAADAPPTAPEEKAEGATVMASATLPPRLPVIASSASAAAPN